MLHWAGQDWPQGHFTMGGMLERMLVTFPTVFRPNLVARWGKIGRSGVMAQLCYNACGYICF